ncbi:hypothetical protein LSTR_LSTR002126 [Laodelphax striatellus]|uniref:Uncharacterized protein n=1 Tax=Laodelphax striatellus TaxID=195883 RepID=A0A482WFL4_LAOST|nr:hypothetical protein LSTR_LSTR016437 [Laodelphax striatellus]RZF48060.1 hypothetical protein LSTR_LSTR002126 [Laodelphax striatellus]
MRTQDRCFEKYVAATGELCAVRARVLVDRSVGERDRDVSLGKVYATQTRESFYLESGEIVAGISDILLSPIHPSLPL